MDEGVIALMIPITAVIGACLVIVYLRKFQNDERIAMIEKGVDPQFFNLKKAPSTSWPLRAALLLIGAGIGLLLGNFLENTFHMEEEVAYFSMLFIFGGIGLGISYIIEERKAKEEERNKR
jgi:hypothetical protein